LDFQSIRYIAICLSNGIGTKAKNETKASKYSVAGSDLP